MGQFKPMVKMMTTEPTVELKLAKGGAVKMKKGGSTTKAKKMAMGGLGAMAAPTMPSNMPADMPAGPAPKKPSMASRRKAMMASKMPVRPVMKKGGDVHEDAAQDRAMIKKALAGKKFATGGVVMGQGGYKDGGSVIPVSASKKGAEGYAETKMHTATPDRSPAKTGGVKMGNGGGYKKGGVAKYAKGGGVENNVSTTPPGLTNTTTGGVRKGNAGGYRKGGATKKFADGGAVQDDGRAVKMPQGNKRPPTPVSINQLSGTYKKGGKVKKYAGGSGVISDNEAAYNKFYEDEEKENRETREQFMRALKDPIGTIKKIPRKLGEAVDALRGNPGSVTKTKESVTVAPGKKRGGSC
jgi:hypothetical protein